MTFLQEAPPDCPVCGAEGGRCPHPPGYERPTRALFIEWSDDYKPPRRTDMADAVIATTRIYEEVPIPRSDRTRRVLRYGVGAVVPAEDQKRLGVTSKGTQSSVPLAEVDDSGAVVPLPSSGQAQTTSPKPQRDPVTKSSERSTKKAATRSGKRSTKRR